MIRKRRARRIGKASAYRADKELRLDQRCQPWVKSGNTHDKQRFSAIPPKADVSHGVFYEYTPWTEFGKPKPTDLPRRAVCEQRRSRPSLVVYLHPQSATGAARPHAPWVGTWRNVDDGEAGV